MKKIIIMGIISLCTFLQVYSQTNTNLGTNSLNSITSGTSNTAIGNNALKNATTSYMNSALGADALLTCTTGSYNSGFGVEALKFLTTGGRNSAFGVGALKSVTTSFDNIAFGYGSLQSSTGGGNIAIGSYSMNFLTGSTNNNNIVIGHNVSRGVQVANTSSQLNIGDFIYGDNTTTGSLKLGINFSPTYTMSGSTLTGVTAPTLQATLDVNGDIRIGTVNSGSSSTVLYRDGNGIVKETSLPSICATNNMIPKSDGSGNLSCSNIFDNGTSVGIGQTSGFGYTSGTSLVVGSPTPPANFSLAVNGWTSSTAFVALSDKRFKKNIQVIESPLAKLLKVDGYTYNWNKSFNKSKKLDNSKQIGFLAQDLAKVIPEAVVVNSDGIYGVNYNAITPVIVEAMKEQQKQITSQQIEIDELKLQIKALLEARNYSSPSKIETPKANTLEIVPTPFANNAKAIYSLDNFSGEAVLQVSDISGKVLKSFTINQSKGQIEIGNLQTTNTTIIFNIVNDGKLLVSKKSIKLAE